MKSAIRTVNPPPTTASAVTTTTPTITSTMNTPTTTIPATPNMPRLHTGATSSRTTATFTNLDQFQSPSVPRSSHGENYTWGDRMNERQQYPILLPGSSGVPRTSTMSGNTLNNASATQGRRYQPRSPAPQLGRPQQRQPRPNNNQVNPTQCQPREFNLDSRGFSAESRPTTPQHSRYQTPNQSRRGSAVGNVRHSSLQCHYKDCCKTFGNDNDWQLHKSQYCRYRNWKTTLGFQCAFVGCCVSTPCIDRADHCGRQNEENGQATSITYESLSQLLAHEREHHQILYCVDCHFVFSGSAAEKAEEHRQSCPQNSKLEIESRSGGPVATNMRSTENQAEKIKICLRWVNDVHLVINQHLEPDHSNFVNLDYPERAAEEQGKEPEKVSIEDSTGSDAAHTGNTLCEPTRTAIANQVIGNLKLQHEFLLNASFVSLELTGQERDDVREYLCKIANILRLDLNTDVSSIVPNPTIAVVSAPLHPGEGRSAAVACDIDELDTPAPHSGASRLGPKPVRILSRSTSPRRQPEAEEPTSTESHPQSVATIQSAPVTVLPSPNRNPQDRVVFTTYEGEPLQEIHIPQENQQKYYSQMMGYCLDAVYDWFIRNQDVLLMNCECTNPMPAVGENADSSAPSKGKRQKKHQPDAGRIIYNTNNGGESCSVTIRTRCFLHDVTSRDTHTLPRWTHHLRRLVEQNRIPSSIIANKDSFSGEIQPVDEVRHALKKAKTKTDRDLLALVQQVRKFCWQLKDWEKCKELDNLYGILEDFIRFTKDQEMKEGWVVAKGGKGGRRKGEKRVTMGGSSGLSTKDRVQGSGEQEGGHFRPSFTWG